MPKAQKSDQLSERDFDAWCEAQDVVRYTNENGEPIFYDNKTDDVIFPARTGKGYDINFGMTRQLIQASRGPKPARKTREASQPISNQTSALDTANTQ